MPIFEYRCAGCGHRFETLVARADAATPPCPQCGAVDVIRLLSAFTVVKPQPGPTPGPCGSPECACRVSESSLHPQEGRR